MRILFSIVGLLIVLAIIGFTVKQQLNTLAPPANPVTTGPADNAVPDTSPITSSVATPQQQVQKVQSDVQRALEQGAARASEADH